MVDDNSYLPCRSPFWSQGCTVSAQALEFLLKCETRPHPTPLPISGQFIAIQLWAPGTQQSGQPDTILTADFAKETIKVPETFTMVPVTSKIGHDGPKLGSPFPWGGGSLSLPVFHLSLYTARLRLHLCSNEFGQSWLFRTSVWYCEDAQVHVYCIYWPNGFFSSSFLWSLLPLLRVLELFLQWGVVVHLQFQHLGDKGVVDQEFKVISN